MRPKPIALYFIVGFGLLCLIACRSRTDFQPQAENGVLNLDGLDVATDGPFALSGEWAFYWQQLLTPDEVSRIRPTGFIKIPRPWTKTQIGGQELPASAMATFKLVIENLRPGDLALKLPYINTAYRLFLNGRLAGSAGRIGTDAQTSRPEWRPQIVEFKISAEQLEIVLQISNFHFYKGGLDQDIRLGTIAQIHDMWRSRIEFELFLLGGVVMMGLYHIGLYLLRRKDKSPLYFGIGCVLLGLYTVLTGEMFVNQLAPGSSWQFRLILVDLAYFCALPAFALFVQSLFPDEFSKPVLKLMIVITFVCVVLVVFARPMVFVSAIEVPHNYYLIVAGGYLVAVSIRAVLHKRKGAVLFFTGFLVLFLTSANDALYFNGVIASTVLVPLGIFLFLFIQCISLSARFSSAFSVAERQKAEITTLSETLETKVAERTLELANANQALEKAFVQANQMAIRAEANLKAKNEFLAKMSHEIRNPMDAVINLTELALGMDAIDDQKAYLAKVYNASRSLLRLINDTLDYSKIEAGRMQIENTPFQLAEVFANISAMLAYKAGEKKVDLMLPDLTGLPQTLKGDALRLTQVLINLCDNAIKFTAKGHVAIQVAIELETRSDCRLRFTVSDTGIGIPPEHLPRLFEPFTPAGDVTSRQYGGTGLGLSICKQLVNLMGGQIEARNNPDKGARFQFVLPFERPSAMDAREAPVRTVTASWQADKFPEILKNKRVLVVEDAAINREVITTYLEQAGIRVESAEDGLEAVEAVQKNPYDAILMDIQMPVMDGYAATRKIRQWEGQELGKEDNPLIPNSQFLIPNSQSPIPIIAMTAQTMAGDAENCFKAGMNEFIAKPIDFERLMALLVQVISTPVPGRYASAESQHVPAIPIAEAGRQGNENRATGSTGIDLTDFHNRFGDNPKLLSNVLNDFAAEYSHVAADIQKALESDDTALVRHLLHKLKGISGNISAMDVYQSVITLEHAIDAGDPAAISKHTDGLESAIEQVLHMQAGIAATTSPAETGSGNALQTPGRANTDLAELAESLAKLSELIQNNDLRSETYFKGIKPQLTAHLNPLQLKALEKQLNCFDFKNARTTLAQMTSALDMPGETGSP